MLTKRERAAFSVGRAIGAMGTGSLRGTYEGEVLKDEAQRAGTSFDENRVIIPWDVLSTRDMTAAGVSGSNYLVGSDIQPAVDVLRAVSATAAAGATVLPDLKGDAPIPRVTASSTAYWLTNEATDITESQPTVGQLSLTPKTVGAFLQMSRLLHLQSEADALVRREVLATIGEALDLAALNGPGTSGQPTGLLNTAGIQTQSGTSLGWAGIAAMQRLAAVARAEPTAWVSAPAVRELLQKREVATGSGMVWTDNRMAGAPAITSTSVPAATLITGDWSNLVLGIWGSGVNIEVDPFSGFTTGIIGVRCLLTADVGLVHPAAFVVATSIT